MSVGVGKRRVDKTHRAVSTLIAYFLVDALRLSTLRLSRFHSR